MEKFVWIRNVNRDGLTCIVPKTRNHAETNHIGSKNTELEEYGKRCLASSTSSRLGLLRQFGALIILLGLDNWLTTMGIRTGWLSGSIFSLLLPPIVVVTLTWALVFPTWLCVSFGLSILHSAFVILLISSGEKGAPFSSCLFSLSPKQRRVFF